jgi:hypothetical protein
MKYTWLVTKRLSGELKRAIFCKEGDLDRDGGLDGDRL